jgi:hypothetical protein
MRKVALLLAAAAFGCSSTPTRPTGEAKKAVVFAQPIARAQQAAVDSLVVLGFDVKRSEPSYVEGARPRKMGLFVGSGGETLGVWLEPVSAEATKVEVDTARSFVGIAGQKVWDEEVLAEMEKTLGKRQAP